MKFSRNPVSGELEIYTDDGVYLGIVSTMGDVAGTDEEAAQDGGPGSGNFNHSGRPGKVGGSGKGNGSGTISKRCERGSSERTEQVSETRDLLVNTVHFRVPSRKPTPREIIEEIQSNYGELDELDSSSKEEFNQFIETEMPKSSGDSYESCFYDDGETKYINPQKLLDEDNHYDMLAVCMDLRLGVDILECLTSKEACRKALKSYYDGKKHDEEIRVPGLENMYENTLGNSKKYRKEMAHIREADKSADKIFGKETCPARSYYELVEKSQENLSFEQYAVQNAYVNGGFGTNAEALNRKMYTGAKLTDDEKRIVELLRSSAVETDSDLIHYRMVNSSSLVSIFGENGPEVGKEKTFDSFSSTSCGAVSYWWRSCNAMLRFHTKKGQKVIAPYNPNEGEILLLNGLTGKVTSVKKEDGDFPVFFDDRKDPRSTQYVHVPNSKMINPDGETFERIVIDIEVTSDGSDIQDN